MDNVTVIVDNTIQDVTVQVATTGITVDQANQIVANTAKVTYPSEDSTKVGFISVTQAVDLDTIKSDTATNNAKVSDINHVSLELPNVDNTSDLDKPVSTATQQLINALDDRVEINDAKVGITPEQSNDIITNNAKVGITTSEQNQIIANTAKVGITAQQASDIISNNAKVGITTQQAADIVSNNSKVGITSQQASDIVNNNAKVGITAVQASDIITNNAKVGITAQQISDIETNNSKVGITTDQANAIVLNTAKVSDINHVSIELPNVDNTSDLDKPISTATQSALDLKLSILQDYVNTQNTFKSVSFAMDYSDRVRDDNGIIESRDCVMSSYLKMIN